MASAWWGLRGADPPSLLADCQQEAIPAAGVGDPAGHHHAMREGAGHPAEPLPWDNRGFYQVLPHCSGGKQTRSALSPLPAHRSTLCLSFPTSQNPPCKAPSELLDSWGY